MGEHIYPNGTRQVKNRPQGDFRFGWKTGLNKTRFQVEVNNMVPAKVEEVRSELLQNCPWVIEADTVAIETFCKVKARYDLLNDWVMRVIEGTEVGIKGQTGVMAVPTNLLGEVSRAEGNLMKATENLGLDPTGRARLLKDLGIAKQAGMNEQLKTLASKGGELRRGRDG